MPLSITVLHATGGGSGVNVLDSWDAAGGTEGDGGGAAGALAKGADARVAFEGPAEGKPMASAAAAAPLPASAEGVFDDHAEAVD
jgi:hypothetical protein